MWAIEASPGPKAAYRGSGIILLPAILLAATGKAWLPTVDSLTGGTTSRLVPADALPVDQGHQQ